MKEPELCVCGVRPVYTEEPGLIDFLVCPNCGIEGKPFYDGSWEWLVSDWNSLMSERKILVGGDGI